jgi:hypothetical protein
MSTRSRQTSYLTPFRPSQYKPRQDYAPKRQVEDGPIQRTYNPSSEIPNSEPTTTWNDRLVAFSSPLLDSTSAFPSLSPDSITHPNDSAYHAQAIVNSASAQKAMRFIPPSQSEPPHSLVPSALRQLQSCDSHPHSRPLDAVRSTKLEQGIDWRLTGSRDNFDRHNQFKQSPQTPSLTKQRSDCSGEEWRQPRFQPIEKRCDEMAAKARMLPPVIGGRSKKDQLGSVSDSWGPVAERTYGMFEIEDDPPSRSASPFKDEGGKVMLDREDEINAAKIKSLLLARAGTVYDGSEETLTSKTTISGSSNSKYDSLPPWSQAVSTTDVVDPSISVTCSSGIGSHSFCLEQDTPNER